MKLFDHRQGKYYSVHSANIYVEEIGDPSAEVLLFLHGGFGNIEDFNEIIPFLKNKYRMIGIDSAGQGKSTIGNETLSYEWMQEAVEKIMDLLDIKQLSIIGLSDGGIIAYRLACCSGIEVKRLITIGSRWHYNNAVETKEILTGVTAAKWKEKFPYTYEKYQSLNPAPDFDKLSKVIVQMWMDDTSTGYPNEKVKNINASSLIIRGDKDHLVKRNFVTEASNLIKNSSLANIPFAGHVVYDVQKEILMQIINHFLK